MFVLTLHCMVLNTCADSFCLSLQLQVLHFQVSLEFTCMFVLLSLSKHLINRPLLVILYTASATCLLIFRMSQFEKIAKCYHTNANCTWTAHGTVCFFKKPGLRKQIMFMYLLLIPFYKEGAVPKNRQEFYGT